MVDQLHLSQHITFKSNVNKHIHNALRFTSKQDSTVLLTVPWRVDQLITSAEISQSEANLQCIKQGIRNYPMKSQFTNPSHK